jgi:hypothetical protein
LIAAKEILYRLSIAHINLQRHCCTAFKLYCTDDLLSSLTITKITDSNMGALTRQRPTYCGSDAARAACYNRCLLMQTKIHHYCRLEIT